MPISRNKVALAASAAVLLGVALPALGQQHAPESILPPGFNEPQPTPTPSASPTSSAPAPTNLLPGPALPSGEELGNSTAAAIAPDGDVTPTLDAAGLARAEMPDFAKRTTAHIGLIGPRDGGQPLNAFGHTSGRYLDRLMERLDAPIASRWLSIGLRRTLASDLTTPADLDGADFAAERAWLLVRMGEPIVARAITQHVDTANFTPKLYEATLQAGLAAGDPAALCPVADAARDIAPDRAWVLAQAFCAGLAGHPDDAGQKLDAARRRGTATGIDLLLAQKIMGTGAQGRQAVTIEWDGVKQLTAWRYGLAIAGGVLIPDPLFATVNPRVRLWQAQAPMLDAATREPFAELAAAQGVLSSAALVDLFGEVDESEDQSSAAAGIARDVRSAYADPDPATRLTAMRRLWDEPHDAASRYARLVLTARAATTIVPGSASADQDRLIAAMLSSGYVPQALRWRTSVTLGSDGWALLTLADPDGAGLGRSDIAAYQSRGTDPTGRKSAMLFAALAGLGRLDSGAVAGLAPSLQVDTGLANSWTRALGRAAQRREPGTVVLLCGIGMQTRDWHGVSPTAFYHMIAALHRTGQDGLARLMAVEALTRL
ncbi:hypothetical protein ACLB0R_14385 [Sphingomonas sp. GlSt437]|uniref:hypothetical protein n=1 Tax=Sphingomonas sp. GlSt437 TaxID=3389970 RepID=UPI003A83C1BD